MLSKLMVFGAGYVLGAKAGRERYDQIVGIAQQALRRLDERGVDTSFLTSGRWTSILQASSGSGQSKV